MSFSPEVDESYYLVANLFARYDDTSNPLPNYATFRYRNGISSMNYRKNPVGLPTLYSFGNGGTEKISSFNLEETGGDYLIYGVKATLAYAPVTTNRSKFLEWRDGFGFAFFTQVWIYANGAPGHSDGYVNSYLAGDDSDSWMGVGSEFNGAEAANYYETQFATSPYEMFAYDIRFASTYTRAESPLRDAIGRDRPSAEESTQVLYGTDFVTLYGDNSAFKLDGSWVFPSSRSTTANYRHYYPYVYVPTVMTESPGADLELFKANFNHNYNSGYDFVRQDIKERFKTVDIINNQRDEHVNAIVQRIRATLVSTNDVPRGFTLRKQVSPKVLKQNYTSFTDNDNMSVDTTTTMTAGMSSTTVGGGTY